MTRTQIFIVVVAGYLAASCVQRAGLPIQEIPVLPGAVGFGVMTPAGRGGTVCRVTNLQEAGPGSLRDAVETAGPRVIIFDVSGTIRMTRDLAIREPYCTIAGQTAPSPGITLRGASFAVETHDVLVQHLRIRVGDDPNGPDPENRDGLQCNGKPNPVFNVVLDHCSVSWATDENIQFWFPDVHDVTLQHCISGNALHASLHPKGAHSMGLLIGPGERNITMISNLLAHNKGRNPRLGKNTETEFINNVVYNWGNLCVDTEGAVHVIGNVFLRGRDTGGSYEPLYLRSDEAVLYGYDNVGFVEGNAQSPVISSQVPADEILPSASVLASVLSRAGARPADRDVVDMHIINDVANGTGRIIDSQDEVGGWPILEENTKPLTLPANPNDDDDTDGYTNLEEWLHGLAAAVEGW